MCSLCTVDINVAVNNIKPWKFRNGYPLHCCQATKYVVLLSTICTYVGLNVKYLILLSDFNQMWIDKYL